MQLNPDKRNQGAWQNHYNIKRIKVIWTTSSEDLGCGGAKEKCFVDFLRCIQLFSLFIKKFVSPPLSCLYIRCLWRAQIYATYLPHPSYFFHIRFDRQSDLQNRSIFTIWMFILASIQVKFGHVSVFILTNIIFNLWVSFQDGQALIWAQIFCFGPFWTSFFGLPITTLLFFSYITYHLMKPTDPQLVLILMHSSPQFVLKFSLPNTPFLLFGLIWRSNFTIISFHTTTISTPTLYSLSYPIQPLFGLICHPNHTHIHTQDA